MNNQECLNKLVKDCYGGQWPWEKHDIAMNENRKSCGVVPYFLETQKDVEWINMVNKEKDLPSFYYPLAGTWVEGRLRELMGEAFVGLHFTGEKYCAIYWIGSFPCAYTTYKDTPIQALCAGLREVLKTQKEVSGE